MLYRSFYHTFDDLLFDAPDQWLEPADTVIDQWFRRILPGHRRHVEERLRPLREGRQNRLQIERDNAKQVDAHGADSLHLPGAVRFLDETPRCVAIDVAIRQVGQRGDLTHGAADGPGVVQAGQPLPRADNFLPQGRIVERRRQHRIEVPVQEPRAPGCDIDDLADQIRVYTLHEVVEIDIHVVCIRRQLGREVVPQIFRIEVVQVRRGIDKSASRLRHLRTPAGNKAVRMHPRRRAELRRRQHRGPEEGVEIDDVLADEVMHLTVGVGAPELVEVDVRPSAVVLEARHVSDASIHPHVEVFALGTRNLEAEVRRVPADIPRLQTLVEPLGELVGDLRLNRTASGPGLQEVLGLGQVDEIVHGRLQDGHGTRQDGAGLGKIRGVVGRAAHIAVVARLIRGAATGTGATHVTVGKEQPLLGVVELLYFLGEDMALLLEPLKNEFRVVPILVGMRAMEVVVRYMKAGEIRRVRGAHRFAPLLGRHALFLGLQHGRRAMRIFGADVDALIAQEALKTHPDIGLDVFQQVTEVKRAVRIRQCAGDENPSLTVSFQPHGYPRDAKHSHWLPCWRARLFMVRVMVRVMAGASCPVHI